MLPLGASSAFLGALHALAWRRDPCSRYRVESRRSRHPSGSGDGGGSGGGGGGGGPAVLVKRASDRSDRAATAVAALAATYAAWKTWHA